MDSSFIELINTEAALANFGVADTNFLSNSFKMIPKLTTFVWFIIKSLMVMLLFEFLL